MLCRRRRALPAPSSRPLWALALALVAWLAFACSSDTATDGDSDGATLDGGLDADLSVEFGTPDVGQDVAYESDTVGLGCSNQTDCSAGEVCVGADPANDVEGYCTILDCVAHPDCTFGLDDELGVFCCSDFGEFRGCFREDPGSVCGDGEGEQGDDCGTGGQSDCEGDEYFCIDVYDETFCSAQCDPRTPGDCDDGSWCFPTGGTSGLCIPSGDTPDGEACAEEPGTCQPGSICDGAFGDEPLPASVCSHLCSRDAECLADEWCRIFPGQQSGTCISVGEVGPGGSCAEDRWSCERGLYCLNEGTRFARCTALCERESDCDEGFFCSFVSPQLGTCNPIGDRETGESCADDPFDCVEGAVCASAGNGVGYNPDAYCAESCLVNPTTCGEGFYCQDFGDQGSFCQPDGEAGAGESCEGPLDCEAGTVCVYYRLEGEDREGRCQPLCSDTEPCDEDDTWCTGEDGEDGVCLDEGSLAAGAECDDEPFDCPEGTFCGGDPAICLLDCADDPEGCPNGFACSGEEGDESRFCLPFGDAEVGDSCEESDECVAGASCALGAGDEGQGICSIGCGDSEDCPDDFWCLRTAGLGLCLPEGPVATGGDCDQDRFSCDEGNLCVFGESDEAYCARDCTGFAARCTENQVCRWVGAGLSLCLGFGATPPGGSCADEPEDCDASSFCVNAGEEAAFCAEVCTFDSATCGDADVCTFLPGGLGLCLPPGFDTDGLGPL